MAQLSTKIVGVMVGREGFEPSKAYADRFTVCSLWPLGYLPELFFGNSNAYLFNAYLINGIEDLGHPVKNSFFIHPDNNI